MATQGDTTAPSSGAFDDGVTLDCGSAKAMNTVLFYPVICVATANCLATTNAGNGKVYSFLFDSKNFTRRVFSQHKTRVHGMAHLHGDAVVSADRTGKIYSWNARTMKVLDEWQIEASPRVLYVMNLTPDSILVATTSTSSGNVAQHLYIFSHQKGHHVRPQQNLKLKPRGIPFGAYDGIYCVKTLMKAYKMDTEGKHRDVLSHPQIPPQYNYEFFGAVTKDYIVLSYANEKMFIYRNLDKNDANQECPLLTTIHIRAFMERHQDSLRAVTVIARNLFMVTTKKFGIYFINIQAKVLAKIAVTKSNNLRNSCVLVDGRICVVGADAYCAVYPCPPQVKLKVAIFAAKMNPNAPTVIAKKVEVQSGAVMGMTQSTTTMPTERRNDVIVRPVSGDNQRVKYGFREHLEERKNRLSAATQAATQVVSLKANQAASQQALAENGNASSLMHASYALDVGRLKERMAADRVAHQAEITDMREKTAAERTQFQIRIAALNQNVADVKDGEADWKAKYLQVSAEKDRYAKDVEEGEARWAAKVAEYEAAENARNANLMLLNKRSRESMDMTMATQLREQKELKEVKMELEDERMKSRRYKSEINIQNINMKAQLEIQKIKLEECKEDLRIQKKKTEKAENEFSRIRDMDGYDNDTKKRKFL